VQKKQLLLVEDSLDDEMLAQRAFKKSQLPGEMITARDGAEALDYIFNLGPEALPRLILLDLKLPKRNGLEVLEKIKAEERTRQIPVVILTSSREERDMADSYRLGANSYIVKPVDFEEFVEVVKKLGQYWLLLNQLPGR
jgi:CheY-like chemotaxis protein